jgi:bifunctional ADP-heptose synthase (sugar kinase/adenylyltransferase)
MINLIKEFIDKSKDFKVLVIGETIIDEFIEVIYEGQSMKSFCPVFKYTNSPIKSQIGGVGAIIGHLKDFVNSIDVITNNNREIVKTRFVDRDGNKKHIELNKINNSDFVSIEVDTHDYDLVILADFGHGFCDKLNIKGSFHLMCQTNSNNFGFNRLSKWKNHHKRSVCLDLREASLQINRKLENCSEKEVLEIFNYEINSDNLFITLGKDGSFYSQGKYVIKNPVFESKVIDTIGAGDTFFAFSSLLSSINNEINDFLFIPSLAASLTTNWVCNEKSVTKENLLKYANQYL